jgi:hypothetical protein
MLLGRTRRELGASMDNAELEWWGVADSMGLVPDPILQAAQVRSTTINAQGGKTKPSDFLPPLRATPRAGAEAQRALFLAATAHLRKG